MTDQPQWKCARCQKPLDKCKGHLTSEPPARQVAPKAVEPKVKRKGKGDDGSQQSDRKRPR
jgi:hypothetical protein